MKSNQYETQFSFERPSFRHENVSLPLPQNNSDKRFLSKNMPTFAGKTEENYETWEINTSLYLKPFQNPLYSVQSFKCNIYVNYAREILG